MSGGLLGSGLKALVVALVGTLAVRWLALATIHIPAEFPPLAIAAPTIFFTSVSTVGAVAVFALVRRFSARPVRVFRGIALVVLLVSFLPDLWLLTEGAAETFPGATIAGVTVLMLMHVVAAAAIVWALTGGSGPNEAAAD